MNRSVLFFAVCLSAFALLFHSPPAHGQKKKDGDVAKLQKRIQALERENNQHEQRIKSLLNEVRERERKIDMLEASLKKARKDDAKDDKSIADLKKQLKQHDLDARAGLVHAAYFRLKPDAGQDQVKSFLDTTPRVLGKIVGVRALWVGRPSARGSGTTDYQVGFVAIFDDADALRRFENDPAYKKHAANLRKSWEPIIYDLQRE